MTHDGIGLEDVDAILEIGREVDTDTGVREKVLL